MGWSLRRIERDTGINRDTAARYLREAGIAVKKPGRPSKQTAKPAISAAEVPPDSTVPDSKPANMAPPDPSPAKPPSPSTSEPFRDTIEEALSHGRNAKAIWQDMAQRYGAATTDEACKLALEMGVHQYPFVRKYLKKHGALTNALQQVDPIIRQLDLYRDLIAEKTKESTE